MRRYLLALLLVAGTPEATAQDLPAGVRLGMGPDELRQALPALDLLRRPVRLAGGLVGRWRLASTEVAGLTGSQTYFFARGELRRVEFLAEGVDEARAGAAFDALLRWGRGVYGQEQAAADARGRTAGWSSPAADVYARLVTAPRAGLQLVFIQRAPRDGSTL